MSEGKGKIFFFSDLHLGAEKNKHERAEKLSKVDRLFEKVAKEGKALYMLGDIFDFWFEYNHAILSENYELLHRISSLIDIGIEIHFLGGNHDFWAGDFLRSIGINVHRLPIVTELYGKKLFLAHGDGFAESDWGYRKILKPILRNHINIFLFKKIHPDFAIRLGQIASGCSRKITGRRENPYLNEYRNFAKNKIDNGYDAVIFGHTHIPEKKVFSNGIYFNLGNFFENFSYLTLDKGQFSECRV
ncbi:MAG: UDP-2,3-diacylglucosamine diphosphatase [Candidatus Zixiibacteriota bacterium]